MKCISTVIFSMLSLAFTISSTFCAEIKETKVVIFGNPTNKPLKIAINGEEPFTLETTEKKNLHSVKVAGNADPFIKKITINNITYEKENPGVKLINQIIRAAKKQDFPIINFETALLYLLEEARPKKAKTVTFINQGTTPYTIVINSKHTIHLSPPVVAEPVLEKEKKARRRAVTEPIKKEDITAEAEKEALARKASLGNVSVMNLPELAGQEYIQTIEINGKKYNLPNKVIQIFNSQIQQQDLPFITFDTETLKQLEKMQSK